MPTYELSLVLRQMSRPEIVSVLKRTAECIFDKGGIIRKLENLGSRALPHKISEHGLVHREGNYFAIQFDTAPTKIVDLNEEYGRDIDIIRRHIFKLEEPKAVECTLHEELQPPAYRKDVQKMIEIAKRKQKKKYDYNSGLDYYPFQK
ncbi:probable 28S ribosomal protein S6, mitochondrial [Episyrphus balteatus]|uniref:probable 28S ribosomal protein S6, mitochondrial n=1 Tax=Episyrphus balteatus TaxID=286459 RepID=UPI0024854DC6|nr:probable 28S ribosomal protein S6, mitochondrial [Episyrphus balteatus]